jgi:hypothetical protein
VRDTGSNTASGIRDEFRGLKILRRFLVAEMVADLQS